MTLAPSLPAKHATALGVSCGAGAALFWALGFVAARHGVLVGCRRWFSRCIASSGPASCCSRSSHAAACAIWAASAGGAAFALTVFGGLPLALLSYFGYVFVPLGHGGVIQPSCAALGGLVLARLVLKEALPLAPRRRRAGHRARPCASSASRRCARWARKGSSATCLFVAAGTSFAIFGMLLRLWRIAPMRAAAVTSVLSLAGLPRCCCASTIGGRGIC